MIANGFILAKVFNRISIKTLLDHSAGRPTPAQPCNQGDLRGTRDWSSAAPPPADALGEISAHSRAPPVAAQTSVSGSAGKGGEGWRGSRTKWQIMLLTITTTADNASDLGFLLHKHPGRVQAFDVSVGTAHVFYPEVGEARTTGARLLEGDPAGLFSGRSRPPGPGRRRVRARAVRERPSVRGLEHARGRDQGGVPDRAHRALRRPSGAGRLGYTARAARARAARPRRDRPRPAGLGAARLAGHGRLGAARPGDARLGGVALPGRPAGGHRAAGRRA